MWKWIFAVLLLSTSCFANFVELLSDQMLSDQLFVDQEFEGVSEDTLFVSVEELEEIIETLSRAKSSHSKHVKIWFVDNSNPNSGNGSYKNPFNTLLAAQNASKKRDIIFVFPGDNTTKGMDQGFVMKDRQRLLGAGVHHKIDFPERKLIVRAPSTTLPHITNTSGSVVILANSCEVSGMFIEKIRNGDGILGGDSSTIPQTRGIKNAWIRKNVIGGGGNLVLNGAINLPNCRGKLVIQNNYIFDVLGVEILFGKGIRLFNVNVPISSHVTIKKNVVSNTGSSGIFLSHSSPRGKVKALVQDNRALA